MDTQLLIVLTSFVSMSIGIGLGYWTQQTQIKWLTSRHKKLILENLNLLSQNYPLVSKPEPTKMSAFVPNKNK
tara:strand:- start:1519 stop:1737 length:219 start_codon:yes stop_codon:yes gene_type:complete